MSKAKLFVIAAPSGAGKSSLVNALAKRDADAVISISYTTRPKRSGEIADVDYYFTDNASFEKMIAADAFLEHAKVMSKVQDYYYGTSKSWVEQQLVAGKHVILEIDWQGAQQIFKKFPKAEGIFILPPSLEVLYQRLMQRGRDSVSDIDGRMSVAKDEISHYRDYHYIVINDDFNHALDELAAIFAGEHEAIGPNAAKYPPHVAQLLAELLA
jgi:guanylate kinase